MQLVTKFVSRIAISLLVIGAIAFILAASAASAQQYTDNGGNLTVEPSNTTPSPGDSVTIVAHVTDSDSNPVADVDVEFTITSNPGDAKFINGSQSITETSDAEGKASTVLETGSTPGTIVVRTEASGEVSQVSVNTGSPQSLPNTGGALGASDSGQALTAIALAAIGLALFATVALGFLKMTRRSARKGDDQYYI